MAKRVFVHVGLPKTATSYLQTLVWTHRDALKDAGLLLPGSERRDHLWATHMIEHQAWFYLSVDEHKKSAWERIKADVAAWDGDALISHEFLGSATQPQATRAIRELAADGAEVHLILTAREPLGLFAASWQESLKNLETEPMEDYSREVLDYPGPIWNWRALDARLVLERWTEILPADRVHVLPLAAPHRNAARDEIWQRFAGVLGVDPALCDTEQAFPNESMGVVEAETLRRVNPHLQETFVTPLDKGTYVRSYLADDRLVPRGGERFWPQADRIEECRVRGRDAVAYIEDSGFDVVGHLEDLLVPDDLPERRTPDSVTDSEVAEVAVELVATMLDDLRALRRERRDLRARIVRLEANQDLGWRESLARRFPRVRRLLRP